MVDLAAIRQAARKVTDENGEEVMQIPLKVWEDEFGPLEPELPQHERIKALLKKWEAEPDDTPAEWWDEFEAFLRENRVRL